MQNAGPSYQGSAQPGVNFSDRSYDNQIGAHCQPTSYQPYINAPYHPVASPRPHHYGNHQMQQGIPYNSVHHGGAYAPNQNQYGPNTNQDMYRNHHPAYVGGNNRNMPSKPAWGENTTPNTEMMQPYNQLPPQTQMMNNPPQMPVSAMRSPPQGTPMSMNPAQSPGPQHYRQLQSPNHSPHSWPQVQVPSPGILHSTRTTPSPLSTHARSPGHSQPFSPPPTSTHHSSISVNLQTHTSSVVQDSDQCVSNISNPSKDTGLNPLHSLQKMVMLDQEMKPNLIQLKCDVTNDNCDQIISQSSDLNVIEEQNAENESKSSSYSTYFNLDEKCIDSQAQSSSIVSTDYSNTSSICSTTGCNSQSTMPYSTVSKTKDDSPKNAETCVENMDAEGIKSCVELQECSNSESSQLLEPIKNIGKCNILPKEDCSSSNITLSTISDTLPTISDTLPTISDTLSTISDTLSTISDTLPTISDTLPTISDTLPIISDTLPESSIHSEEAQNEVPPEDQSVNSTKNELVEITSDPLPESLNESSLALNEVQRPVVNSESVSSVKIENECDLVSDIICKEEKQIEVTGNTNLNLCEVVYENLSKSPKPNLRRRKVGVSYEEIPSPENVAKVDLTLNTNEIKVLEKSPKKIKEAKVLDKTLQKKPRAKKCDAHNERPVKVVIHRIRKSDTDDTWHVPNSNSSLTQNQEISQSGNSVVNDKSKESPKVSNIGPQIIILSPAMSKKKFGTAGSGNPNSVITINEDKTVVETVDGKVVSETTSAIPEKQLNNQKSLKSKQKKKPTSGKSGVKSSASKKGKGKKNCKNKKKIENTDMEVVPKVKRTKVFNGPYVHITGSKQNPVSIKVVNVAPREEEKDPRQQKPKREFSCAQREFGSIQRRIRVGHSCTLSPHYDAFNKDKTWLCSFCHKGSHHHGLGDLYGPYYISGHIKSESTIPNELILTAETTYPESATTQVASRGSRSKRRKSELSEECVKTSPPSKKSKQAKKLNVQSSQCGTPSKSPSNLVADISTHAEITEQKSTEPLLHEVWIHEDCVVWCQGVSLMGHQIHGLDEAIHEAAENMCSACKLVGATLGCWSKGCTEQYHYSCAKEKGCEMNIDVFSLLCPNHLKRQQTNKRIKIE